MSCRVLREEGRTFFHVRGSRTFFHVRGSRTFFHVRGSRTFFMCGAAGRSSGGGQDVLRERGRTFFHVL